MRALGFVPGGGPAVIVATPRQLGLPVVVA